MHDPEKRARRLAVFQLCVATCGAVINAARFWLDRC
jgi:hypothetical protein